MCNQSGIGMTRRVLWIFEPFLKGITHVPVIIETIDTYKILTSLDWKNLTRTFRVCIIHEPCIREYLVAGMSLGPNK